MKKLIIILAGVVIFLIIAILFAINVLFFREITPSVPQAAQAPVAEEPVLSEAIPSSAIPTSEEIIGLTDRAVKKHKILEEREAEAERIRTINRAAALLQLKALEVAPAPSPLPKKVEVQQPSAEELKELEKKGIVSY